MKKFASTFIFAGIVLVVGLYTYFFEYKVAQEEEIKEKEGIKLLRDLSSDQVEFIRWQKKSTQVELAKKDGAWRLVKPLQEEADKWTVENILNTLFNEKEEILKSESGESVDPKKFGFNGEMPFIELGSAKSKKKFFISGQKTFDERQYHVMAEGKNEIYLTSTSFGDILDKPLKDLRSKEILGEVSPDFISLKYKDNSEVQLEKKDGNWVYIPKPDLKLDPKAISDWISALKYVKAHDFASETSSFVEQKKFGLDQPTLKIRLKVGSKNLELKATTRKKDQKVFMVSNVRPNIFEGTAAMLGPLEKSLDDFRDKKFPFTFDEKLVTKILVEKPGLKVSVNKAKDQWQLDGEEKKEVDQEALNSLLTKIRELSVDRFLSAKKTVKGLSPASQKISFRDQSGNTVLDFVWGEKFVEGSDRFVFVKTNLATEPLILKAYKIDDLKLDKIVKDKVVKASSEKPPESQKSL